MASNFEAISSSELGKLNSLPPEHTSSPTLLGETQANSRKLNDMNKPKSDVTNAKDTMMASGASSKSPSNKRDNGSRTSPTKPKYNLMIKKPSKSSLQNKTGDELYIELINLKKLNLDITDENLTLKRKLLRAEEEQSKRSELEKSSTNMLVSNMKRKIQRLEESIKEKENNIKKLQTEARMAKHEAKIAVDTNRQDTKRGLTLPKEALKLQKAPLSSAYSSGSHSAEAGSPSKSLLLLNENRQLRERIRKALSIHDAEVFENYKDVSSDELIAENLKLKEEVEVFRKIAAKAAEANQNGAVDVKEMELLAEIEKLNSTIIHLKRDRLSYFEASETKDLEINSLKEELDRMRKELEKTRIYGAVPKLASVVHTYDVKSKKPDLKKRSATTASSDAGKRFFVSPKPKAASASTLKSSTPATASNASGLKSKVKKVKDGVTSHGNANFPVVAAVKNASPKRLPKDRNDVETFRQNVAARKIQKSWKSCHSEVVVNGCGDADKQINFEANGNDDGFEDDIRQDDLQEVAMTIQSVARGNDVRSALLSAMVTSETANSHQNQM